MASSIVTPGILYLWLMQRKQRLASQLATASPPNGSATTGLGSAGTSHGTLPSADSSAASATSEVENQPNPGDSSTSEPSLPGISTTDSILIVTPTTDSPSHHDSPRSQSRRVRSCH